MSHRGLIVPPETAAFVGEGRRDLPLAPEIAAEVLAPGQPLRLVDRRGAPLGLALADPENERLRLLARADEGFEALGPAFFGARVESALALRRGLGLTGERAAYRIVHGAGDGLPGFTADVFGTWAVLHVYSRAFAASGQLLAAALIDAVPLRGVVVKVRSRGAASQGRVRQEVVGAPPPPAHVVEERGVPFEVHLDRGLNVGLFTDMREHRHGLARFAAGREVLNAFSYTGTLSVVAARAGAASVTSVDLSAGVQAWARDNLRLSGLDPESACFRFEVDDVGRFLERAAGDGRRFHLVLIDPPTFSAARGAGFALERDYPGLVARACSLLREGGLLWLACNAREASLPGLAGRGLQAARRHGQILETGGLPPDHPTLPSQPEDRYLEVALLRVE